jgi:methionyl-tRNA formyltransferase
MTPLNTIFFGTPQFAASLLKHIKNCPICQKNLHISGVVTQPDKPLGRKKLLTSSPVAVEADKHHLPVFKPQKPNSENLAHLKLLKPNLFLVIAYGQIIPPDYLNTPSFGTLNIHYSLLPKYRGALCLSEAIKNEDKETGVTLMLMDKKLDHGPIIAQKSLSISPDDDVASLQTKLEPLVIDILHTSLPDFLKNLPTPTPQDESLATYTPATKTRNHQSAFIPVDIFLAAISGQNAAGISALIRSQNPDPGAWTKISDTELKILQVSLENNRLLPLSVQIPGKSPISWTQFLSGHKIS